MVMRDTASSKIIVADHDRRQSYQRRTLFFALMLLSERDLGGVADYPNLPKRCHDAQDETKPPPPSANRPEKKECKGTTDSSVQEAAAAHKEWAKNATKMRKTMQLGAR